MEGDGPDQRGPGCRRAGDLRARCTHRSDQRRRVDRNRQRADEPARPLGCRSSRSERRAPAARPSGREGNRRSPEIASDGRRALRNAAPAMRSGGVVATLAFALIACGSMGCRRSDEAGAAPPGRAAWFEEIAARAGIRFVHASGHKTKHLLPEIMGGGVALFDMDNDGFLDLYLVQSGALSFERDRVGRSSADQSGGNRLYHNRGDGTFEDVTVPSGAGAGGYGLGVTAAAVGNGLGVVAGDFDGDGRVDIFVANDRTSNQLWAYQGGGRFQDAALTTGTAVDQDGAAKSGMGVDAADVDDDGDLDLLIVNLDGESDSFFRNRGRFFSDDTSQVGLRTISRPFTRFGAAFVDFDNDGYLDLYEANGRVGMQSERYSSDPYAEPSLLFRGFAGPRFQEVRPRGGTTRLLAATSRGAAFGDIDNDGGVDIVVVNRDGGPYLLHNVVKPRGHWIMLRVLDEHGRDALGAQVTLKVGPRTIRRDVRTAYSYLASNDPRVHVGLGQETAARDVTVRWPDGAPGSFGGLDADGTGRLRRRRGTLWAARTSWP